MTYPVVRNGRNLHGKFSECSGARNRAAELLGALQESDVVLYIASLEPALNQVQDASVKPYQRTGDKAITNVVLTSTAHPHQLD